MRPWIAYTSVAAAVCVAYPCNGQRQGADDESRLLERLADDLFPAQDLDLNYEDLYENLQQLLAHPLNLNHATAEQLRSLFILTEAQVDEIIAYRTEAGPFLSVYELQVLNTFDSVAIQRVLPFIAVESTDSEGNLWQRILKEENNYLILRHERTLEKRRGYREDTDSASRYAGSPDRLYARFRVSRPGDFSAGFTVEKDAGEAFQFSTSNKQAGFDFFSFHLQTQPRAKVKNLIVGDFQTQFGQGLTLGGIFGVGKGAETINTIRRSNIGFMPYTSVNESNFFRGVALTYQLAPAWTAHMFASYFFRDARVVEDSEESLITSLPASGLHRTPGERAARRRIGESNTGVVLSFKKASLDAGLIAHHTRFQFPLMPTRRIHNGFAFSGATNLNTGAYVNYTLHNLAFFSEATRTWNEGWAAVGGVLASLTRHLETSLLWRRYGKDYHSFYSNAVAENTIPVNETGIYWGLKYMFNKRSQLTGYVDMFSFPWLRFRAYAPTDGYEWLLRWNWTPTKSLHIFLQARAESKARNTGADATNYELGQGLKSNYWVNADYVVTDFLSFKTRVQYSTYRLNNSSRGFLILQDANLDLGRFSLSGRYALFDTDDYDNRQYVYERDVWLAYSFPAYNGVGVRRYLLARYSFSKNVDCWIRWAATTYTDRDEIGSGPETIAGNRRNDIKFQVRIRL